MSEHGLPLLYALLVWWFSTGAILYLVGLPRRTFRWTALGATAVLLACLHGVAASSDDASVGGAYAAFTCGLLAWGWHEVVFLTGFVTGPNRAPCPPGCAGWRRFALATGTVIHHELAIAATAALVVALAWGGENQVGAWTFLALWWLRLSAKLNLFLGVPNTGADLLPEQLRHLRGYLARRPMNALFPVSVTAATAAAALLARAAADPAASPAEAAGLTMLATLVGLAVLEHWFMVLPLRAEALWGWGLRSRPPAAAAAAP